MKRPPMRRQAATTTGGAVTVLTLALSWALNRYLDLTPAETARLMTALAAIAPSVVAAVVHGHVYSAETVARLLRGAREGLLPRTSRPEDAAAWLAASQPSTTTPYDHYAEGGTLLQGRVTYPPDPEVGTLNPEDEKGKSDAALPDEPTGC